MKVYHHTINNSHDSINRDRYLVEKNIFLICDGVSSKLNSGEAAQKIIEYIEKYNFPHLNVTLANELIFNVNKIVIDMNSASTFTLLQISDKEGCLLHIGDSECYKIKENKITQLTIPHTHAYQLYKNKLMDKEDIKRGHGSNWLLQALGNRNLIPQFGKIKLEGIDFFILCSDGANYCDENVMKLICETSNDPAKEIAETAKKLGSKDDISVIVIDRR